MIMMQKGWSRERQLNSFTHKSRQKKWKGTLSYDKLTIMSRLFLQGRKVNFGDRHRAFYVIRTLHKEGASFLQHYSYWVESSRKSYLVICSTNINNRTQFLHLFTTMKASFLVALIMLFGSSIAAPLEYVLGKLPLASRLYKLTSNPRKWIKSLFWDPHRM